MDQLSTNVMLIGRSKAGKSSLLNYLFGEKLEETGSGDPVTPKGVFPHSYKYDDSLIINILDTWGLEADKTVEWKQMIVDSVKEHDQKEIKDWVNTIIFCISATFTRAEDFELEMIRSLMDDCNQVVVAITHSDVERDNYEIIKKRIITKTSVRADQVIAVGNAEEKAIKSNKGENEKFGRTEIFNVIIHNLWKLLKTKVPYNVTQKMQGKISAEKEILLNMISKKWNIFNRGKRLEKFAENVNAEMECFLSELTDEINRQFNDAIDYYNHLSAKYAQIGLLDKDIIKNDPEMRFEALNRFKRKMDKKIKKMKENLKNISNIFFRDLDFHEMKDLMVAVKTYISSSKKIKRSLRKDIEKYMDEVENKMNENVKKIKEQLQDIDYDGIKTIMISQESASKERKIN